MPLLRNVLSERCDNSPKVPCRKHISVRLTRQQARLISGAEAVRGAAMQLKIAFQGEPGAFSHAAAHALFPNEQAIPCATFADTIVAVQHGRADYGVVPVENSLYGRITDIYHLLPGSGLFITAEHFLRVEMNLLGVRGATLADVKSVQSLSVALGQCRNFIQKHGLNTINAVDTAGSAREVAEKGDKSVAAIASRFAGEIYGLDLLAENIEDAAHNTTRFIVPVVPSLIAPRRNAA